MLSIESVSKRFSSGNYGVRDLSLVAHGGVLGLLGPNGAGKTTLMQMIATITRPTSGRILFRDADLAKHPDELRRRLGYLPQDFGVYDNLTAFEFLSYFAALKGVHDRKRIGEMLETVNLHTVAKRTIGGFSGGMKQRLGIAQALINDPELVIVDEPTAGLDPEERVRFRNILSDLGFGKLVILSTHIVSDIESIATEIAIMKDGSLVALATPEVLLRGCDGMVWELVVTSEQFEEVRRTMRVSSAVRKPDGVHVRVVSPVPPAGATPAEPTLEDAFLHTMGYAPGMKRAA
ncbi:MAG TPA: ABC transporter ATP-binding protein [Thermoanaerobaculia bacterium]|jgi:ABC-type multidrug transport system ATPase subunit|nr:ABC transporter ATP-binding protein [Thermoanaerobaculia bacterium]